MEGNPRIVEMLSELLASELAAVNTYFLHAKLLANWGYPPLAKRAYDESIDEMRHAEKLIDRIIYFDTIPNMQRLGRVRGGATVTEQLEQELDVEKTTVTAFAEGIVLCREVNDEGTRIILEPILRDGEEAIDWLETQLALIESLGEAAYLAEHVRGDDE